jgi:hypothetical protein
MEKNRLLGDVGDISMQAGLGYYSEAIDPLHKCTSKIVREKAVRMILQVVMDPKSWTQKRPFLRWWAALKMKESQCPERVRVTHPA